MIPAVESLFYTPRFRILAVGIAAVRMATAKRNRRRLIGHTTKATLWTISRDPWHRWEWDSCKATTVYTMMFTGMGTTGSQ